MSIPTITPLPQAPQVTDAPSVFSQRANTFVAALGQLVTETNATTAEINQAVAGALVLFDGYKGDWEAGSFGAGDVVRKDDVFYISIVDSNTQEPPDTNWRELLSAAVTSFDSSGVDLQSTTVQGALEELTLAASISYDPAPTSLTAATVQGAIQQLSTLPVIPMSSSRTMQAADVGGMIVATAGDITIPPDVFSPGATIVIHNASSNNRNVTRGSGVSLFWIDAQDSSRVLTARALATIVCVGENQFVITGQGVQ